LLVILLSYSLAKVIVNGETDLFINKQEFITHE